MNLLQYGWLAAARLHGPEAGVIETSPKLRREIRITAGLPELHSRCQKGLSPPFVRNITTPRHLCGKLISRIFEEIL
jgi:hypothetical protein